MHIEMLDDLTVKILLSAEDMDHFSITYDQMDYNDRNTRQAILNIMQQVQEVTTLPIDQHKLFIEAFPDDLGGCILYVNLMTDKQSGKAFQKERAGFDTPLIFKLQTLDILTACCKRLFYDYAHLIVKSSVYSDERGGYILLLYTYCRSNQRIINIMTEYASYDGKGAVRAAHYKEHSKPVLQDHAIETVLNYLG